MWAMVCNLLYPTPCAFSLITHSSTFTASHIITALPTHSLVLYHINLSCGCIWARSSQWLLRHPLFSSYNAPCHSVMFCWKSKRASGSCITCATAWLGGSEPTQHLRTVHLPQIWPYPRHFHKPVDNAEKPGNSPNLEHPISSPTKYWTQMPGGIFM